MSYVRARPGESIDNLLKRFKKAVEGSGVLADYKKNERYEKPSVKKKKKSAAARKRLLKLEKKAERSKKFEKPSGPNWKWNKDHTIKIPLKSYTSDRNNNSKSKPYRGNKPRFTKTPNYKGRK